MSSLLVDKTIAVPARYVTTQVEMMDTASTQDGPGQDLLVEGIGAATAAPVATQEQGGPPGVTACQLNPWLGGDNRSGRLNT